ncbi:MAG: hypothetical protein RIC82_05055, partial [Parvibaculum sp.]
ELSQFPIVRSFFVNATPRPDGFAANNVAWQHVPCKAVPLDTCVRFVYRSLNSLRKMAKLRLSSGTVRGKTASW